MKSVWDFIKYFSLIVACLVTLLPISVIVLAAFKTKKEFRETGPFELPGSFNVENFVTAFVKGNMAQSFLNTALILAVAITGTIIIGSMAAYALNRFEFRGKPFIMGAFLLATLVPAVTTQVATYQVIDTLGLVGTRYSVMLLFLGTDIVAIYIFMQFLNSISKEVDEAAVLDGANHFTIYSRIIFPLLKPAIATVVIIKGIAVYNEFYIPFLYMPQRELGVISTSLFRFKGPFGAQWEVIAAGVLIVLIPTLILFIFLQRYIYNGLTAGSTK